MADFIEPFSDKKQDILERNINVEERNVIVLLVQYICQNESSGKEKVANDLFISPKIYRKFKSYVNKKISDLVLNYGLDEVVNLEKDENDYYVDRQTAETFNDILKMFLRPDNSDFNKLREKFYSKNNRVVEVDRDAALLSYFSRIVWTKLKKNASDAAKEIMSLSHSIKNYLNKLVNDGAAYYYREDKCYSASENSEIREELIVKGVIINYYRIFREAKESKESKESKERKVKAYNKGLSESLEQLLYFEKNRGYRFPIKAFRKVLYTPTQYCSLYRENSDDDGSEYLEKIELEAHKFAGKGDDGIKSEEECNLNGIEWAKTCLRNLDTDFKKIAAIEQNIVMLGWIIQNAPDGRYEPKDLLPDHYNTLMNNRAGGKTKKLNDFLNKVLRNYYLDNKGNVNKDNEAGMSTVCSRHRSLAAKIKRDLGIHDMLGEYTKERVLTAIDELYGELIRFYNMVIQKDTLDVIDDFLREIDEETTKGEEK